MRRSRATTTKVLCILMISGGIPLSCAMQNVLSFGDVQQA